MTYLEANVKSLKGEQCNVSSYACKNSSVHVLGALCLEKKWSKLLWSKAMCYNTLNFCKTRAFTRIWKSFPQSNYIILAPFHKKLRSLPDWLQGDRPFHWVLRKTHCCLSFATCEMKGLCLAQRPALLWMLQMIVFHCIVKKVFHFQPLPISQTWLPKPNKTSTQTSV